MLSAYVREKWQMAQEEKKIIAAAAPKKTAREKHGWPPEGTELKPPANSKSLVWKYFGAGTVDGKQVSFCKPCEKLHHFKEGVLAGQVSSVSLRSF